MARRANNGLLNRRITEFICRLALKCSCMPYYDQVNIGGFTGWKRSGGPCGGCAYPRACVPPMHRAVCRRCTRVSLNLMKQQYEACPMPDTGDSSTFQIDLPDASRAKHNPKRPWSSPRVILPTDVSTVEKNTSLNFAEQHDSVSASYAPLS